MKTILHRAESRGFFDHGWLKTHHTFSFADYYNPQRINFGALRVLNDDRIEGGTGFDLHPHQNMEVISIPLKGDLEHQDSLGQETGHGFSHFKFSFPCINAVRFFRHSDSFGECATG